MSHVMGHVMSHLMGHLTSHVTSHVMRHVGDVPKDKLLRTKKQLFTTVGQNEIKSLYHLHDN